MAALLGAAGLAAVALYYGLLAKLNADLGRPASVAAYALAMLGGALAAWGALRDEPRKVAAGLAAVGAALLVTLALGGLSFGFSTPLTLAVALSMLYAAHAAREGNARAVAGAGLVAASAISIMLARHAMGAADGAVVARYILGVAGFAALAAWGWRPRHQASSTEST